MAEEIKNTISSEVETKATGLDGVRHSRDSDWTEWTVPHGYVINKDKTAVHVLIEMGSEHTYTIEYDNPVEIVPGTHLTYPTTIRVKTHARSSKGHGAGKGEMKVNVDVYYVKYK